MESIYTVERWRDELGHLGTFASLQDLASHTMLARAWSWHTTGNERRRWRVEAAKLDRQIIILLAQGWRFVTHPERKESDHATVVE